MGQIKMNEDLRETLLILMEECAEVTQAISKCFRFGPDQLKPGKERTNLSMLEEEIGDLMAMVVLLVDCKVGITDLGIFEAKMKKLEQLKQWSNLTINK
jgi:NTP pyrophosphatase (non-canonical NTP hydrolase)